MENINIETAREIHAKVETVENLYANGKGKATVERFLRENKEFWENHRKKLAEQRRIEVDKANLEKPQGLSS